MWAQIVVGGLLLIALGIECPLTTFENWRRPGGDGRQGDWNYLIGRVQKGGKNVNLLTAHGFGIGYIS
jgi:hypothetical protein